MCSFVRGGKVEIRYIGVVRRIGSVTIRTRGDVIGIVMLMTFWLWRIGTKSTRISWDLVVVVDDDVACFFISNNIYRKQNFAYLRNVAIAGEPP